MGWVVSVKPRPRFTPGERTPGTHCIGDWVGPRAGRDAEVKEKTFAPTGDRTPAVQSVVRRTELRQLMKVLLQVRLFWTHLFGMSADIIS
jgi:hypothetical protein